MVEHSLMTFPDGTSEAVLVVKERLKNLPLST
jgi:hypothetical protein